MLTVNASGSEVHSIGTEEFTLKVRMMLSNTKVTTGHHVHTKKNGKRGTIRCLVNVGNNKFIPPPNCKFMMLLNFNQYIEHGSVFNGLQQLFGGLG